MCDPANTERKATATVAAITTLSQSGSMRSRSANGKTASAGAGYVPVIASQRFPSAHLLTNLRNLIGFAWFYGGVAWEDATVGAILLWLLGIPIPIIILLLLLWH